MPTPELKRRWYRLSPDRFVDGLLAVVGLLWLSDRFQLFGFDQHKGSMVLISLAVVCLAALVMLLWWIASLLFDWRFQFGIRSVLAFCLTCSIVVGWLAVEIQRSRRLAETVDWIHDSGGWVDYDWEVDADNNQISNREPPEPCWLRATLGDDFFSEVAAIYLVSGQTTDAGLAQLKGLTKLRELHLDLTNTTDAGLEHLRGLTQLQRLILDGTKITDAGLEHLEGLTQLQRLGLENTNTTDAGLEHLGSLTQLQRMDLDGTKITDAGLGRLKGLTQLQVLSLIDSEITDAGLENLKGLAQLDQLILVGAKVTDAGVEKLRQALPNCKIIH